MQEQQNQVTAGQNIISIKTSADYVINQRLNVRAFYERVINTPVISTSFPSANTNVGHQPAVHAHAVGSAGHAAAPDRFLLSPHFAHRIQPDAMNIPAELKYTKDHEWIRIEGDEAVVGITDFAQGELGDIVFVDIGTEGQDVDARRRVRHGGSGEDRERPLHARERHGAEREPRAGRSIPRSVNKDPYGAGWMVRIKLDNAGRARRAAHRRPVQGARRRLDDAARACTGRCSGR